MALQPIDSPNEVRVDGGKARPEKYVDVMSSGQNYAGQNGPGVDGTVEGARVRDAGPTAGYIGPVEELERNDDTRHPNSKIWVRRDRKPNAYLHTGNG